MTILRNGKKAASVIGAAKMSYVEGAIELELSEPEIFIRRFERSGENAFV